MEKKWAPAEKVFIEFGRMVIQRPKVSGLVLASAAVAAFLGEGYLHSNSAESIAVQLPIPMANSTLERFSLRNQSARAEWENVLDPQGAAITFQHWPLSRAGMNTVVKVAESAQSLTQLKLGETLGLLATAILAPADSNVQTVISGKSPALSVAEKKSPPVDINEIQLPLSENNLKTLANIADSVSSLTQLQLGQTIGMLASSVSASSHHPLQQAVYTVDQRDVNSVAANKRDGKFIETITLPLNTADLHLANRLQESGASLTQLKLGQTLYLLASSIVAPKSYEELIAPKPKTPFVDNELVGNEQNTASVKVPLDALKLISTQAPISVVPTTVSFTKPADKTVPSENIVKLPLKVISSVPAAPASITPKTLSLSKAADKSVTAENAITVKIHAGDNLAKIFRSYQLSTEDLNKIIQQENAAALHKLVSGDSIALLVNSQNQLQKLIYSAVNHNTLTVDRTDKGFTVSNTSSPAVTKVTLPPLKASNDRPLPSMAANDTTVKTKLIAGNNSLSYTGGIVTGSSLYVEARKAGLSIDQANQLVEMFSANHIAQTVKPGDQFNVLYENPNTPSKTTNNHSIVAAQLLHQGRRYSLIRFTDPSGHIDYYTPGGESLHQGILRAPLRYSHISSYYSKSRFEPVLHFFRPHLGIDYAAPSGTAIEAAGNGVVVAMNRRGGYGKTIVIEHDNKFSTLYAHMASFAGKLQIGSVVKQGQVIGFVGRTGLATGPHLHYEIHVNNLPLNPLTVDLPGAPVPEEYMHQFTAQASALLAELNSSSPVQLAAQEESVARS